MSKRIIWSDGPDSILVGRVNNTRMFSIMRSITGTGLYGLQSELPGFGQPLPFLSAGAAMDAAETALVDFTTAVGAVFPDPALEVESHEERNARFDREQAQERKERIATIARAVKFLEETDPDTVHKVLAATTIHTHLKENPDGLVALLREAVPGTGQFFGAWKGAQKTLKAAGLPY